MIENSDISAVHGGSRDDRASKRMAKKRDEFYKMLAKRDDLLNKLCRVQIKIAAVQKSIARLAKRESK